MGDLALQVGEVDAVVVDDRDAADAGRAEVQRHRRAEAAGADHQRVRGEQPPLALDADVVEQEVARVAQQVVVVHRALAAGQNENARGGHGRSGGASAAALSWSSTSALRSTAVLLTSTGLALQAVERLGSWKSSALPNSGGGFGAPLRLGELGLELLARFLARLLARVVLLLGALAALQVLLEVGLARAQRGEQVALGGLVEHDVGHDALGLDRARRSACSSARW